MDQTEMEMYLIGGGKLDHMGRPVGQFHATPNMPMHLPNMLQKQRRHKGMAPQFPGQQFGATIEDIRAFIKKQKRIKGFTLPVVVGSFEHNINISGSARIFLGFALADIVGTTTVKLEINDEVVVQPVSSAFFDGAFTDSEYYSLPRPLSGTDSITLTTVSLGAFNLPMIVYYL